MELHVIKNAAVSCLRMLDLDKTCAIERHFLREILDEYGNKLNREPKLLGTFGVFKYTTYWNKPLREKSKK